MTQILILLAELWLLLLLLLLPLLCCGTCFFPLNLQWFTVHSCSSTAAAAAAAEVPAAAPASVIISIQFSFNFVFLFGGREVSAWSVRTALSAMITIHIPRSQRPCTAPDSARPPAPRPRPGRAPRPRARLFLLIEVRAQCY